MLVYVNKITPRIDYTFKQLFVNIIGIPITFTNTIETFIAHEGAKISYGKNPLGNELFFYAHGLLQFQGIEDIELQVKPWENTICFFTAPEKSAFSFDIFAATFYLLSRYEEYLPHVKDELGRFPLTESLAYKEGFFKTPVVDIWALELKKIILKNFPDLTCTSKKFKVVNLIEAKRPFEFLQRGVLRTFLGFGGDLWKLKLRRFILRIQVLLGFRKDPYDTFSWILNTVRKNKHKTIFFFLIGEGYSFREDFNTKREKYKSLLKYVTDYCDGGLLFSYHSLYKIENLKDEKVAFQDITHRELNHVSTDRQLINLPSVYRNFVELEVYNDYTMYYYNGIGFRASTCTPFLFYDLDFEVKTPLMIHPVVGKTLSLQLGKEKDMEGVIMQTYKAVKAVKGTFSLFFSNKDFEIKRENKTWRYLFSEKLN